ERRRAGAFRRVPGELTGEVDQGAAVLAVVSPVVPGGAATTVVDVTPVLGSITLVTIGATVVPVPSSGATSKLLVAPVRAPVAVTTLSWIVQVPASSSGIPSDALST